MKFKEFERTSHEAFNEVPDEYKEGVDRLVVSREALPHPLQADIYTLGHCLTESYASDWSGPDTTRSQVVLYWGSFKSLADLDPEFDWEEEIWETLTHELRHHLESLAREDALEGVDYALDETFKRADGLDFDPWYYQQGEDLGGGAFQVERDFYFEQLWRPEEFRAAKEVGLTWRGERYRIPRPDELGDVHFVWIDGLGTGPASLELVLIRRQSWWEKARRLFGRHATDVIESVAKAEPAGERGRESPP